MKIITILILILSAISCNEIEKDYINNDYRKDVISSFDSLLTDTFPQEIKSKTFNISYRIIDNLKDTVYADVNRLFVTIDANNLDSAITYFSNVSKQIYTDADNQRVLTPYHFNKGISERRKFKVRNYMFWRNKSVRFEGLLPIPNFKGIIEDNRGERYERPFIEENTAFYVLKSDTIPLDDKYKIYGIENYMPDKWAHGYSKGVFIDKNKSKIMYWVIAW